VRIEGASRVSAKYIDCGESGLCLRMFSPIAALSNSKTVVAGRDSLLKRPITMMEF